MGSNINGSTLFHACPYVSLIIMTSKLSKIEGAGPAIVPPSEMFTEEENSRSSGAQGRKHLVRTKVKGLAAIKT